MTHPIKHTRWGLALSEHHRKCRVASKSTGHLLYSTADPSCFANPTRPTALPSTMQCPNPESVCHMQICKSTAIYYMARAKPYLASMTIDADESNGLGARNRRCMHSATLGVGLPITTESRDSRRSTSPIGSASLCWAGCQTGERYIVSETYLDGAQALDILEYPRLRTTLTAGGWKATLTTVHTLSARSCQIQHPPTTYRPQLWDTAAIVMSV